MGATASVFSDAAPSFAAKVGDKPSASFATVGVPELEVAASGLDVSAICATLVRTVARPADSQRATPTPLSPRFSPPADRPISPAAV